MKLITRSFILGLLSLAAGVSAAELKGTVRTTTGNTADVSLAGDLVPAAGDEATIYFTIPGGDDEVTVATATVASVSDSTVQLKMDKLSGTVAKDQQVRITSASPQKRATAAAKPPTSPVSRAANTRNNPPVRPPDSEDAADSHSLRPVDPDDPSDRADLHPAKPVEPPPMAKVTRDGGGKRSMSFTIPGRRAGDPPITLTIPSEAEEGEIIEIPTDGADGPPAISESLPGDEDHFPAIRLRPVKPAANTATGHFNNGNALLTERKPQEAIASFNKAIALDSKFGQAYYDRGRAFLEAGNFDGVIQDAEKALALGGTSEADVMSLRGSGWTGKKSYDKAIADHTKAIELNPQHAPAYTGRAEARLRKGDPEGALADCNQSMDLEHFSPLTLRTRGYVHAALNKPQRAVTDWTNAMQLEPSYRAELSPLIQKAGGSAPAEPLEMTEEEAMKELIKRVVPPGAEGSQSIRRQ